MISRIDRNLKLFIHFFRQPTPKGFRVEKGCHSLTHLTIPDISQPDLPQFWLSKMFGSVQIQGEIKNKKLLGLAVPEDGTVLVDHDWPARLLDGVAKKVRIGGVKIISMCNTAGMGIYKSDISKKKNFRITLSIRSLASCVPSIFKGSISPQTYELYKFLVCVCVCVLVHFCLIYLQFINPPSPSNGMNSLTLKYTVFLPQVYSFFFFLKKKVEKPLSILMMRIYVGR